jgi:hypothetical protein
MARDFLEIGVVYKNYGRYFIAVSDTLLVSCKNGEFFEIRPYIQSAYKAQRDLDVVSICNNWKVSLEQIDENISKVYFLPSKPRDSVPAKKRGSTGYRNPWVYKTAQ